jgi:hypothetical protein
MGGDRTITAATVNLTVELFDLGTFGPGSSIAQAKEAAAIRLSKLLGIEVTPSQLRIDSVSTKSGETTSKFTRIYP